MKSYKRLALLLVLVLLSSLAGCVSSTKYEALEKENLRLSNELNSTQGKYETLLEQYNTLQQAYDKIADIGEFHSEQDLYAFLSRDKTDEILLIEDKFDCDDFARTLFLNAYKEGYIMAIAILLDSNGKPIHALNMCFIKGGTYLIEPQTDEVQFIGYIWD